MGRDSKYCNKNTISIELVTMHASKMTKKRKVK